MGWFSSVQRLLRGTTRDLLQDLSGNGTQSILYLSLSCFWFGSSVERNRGPKWPCGVCTNNVARNCYSVLCNKCKHWIHFKCSGLKSVKVYDKDYRCRTCTTPLPQQDPPSANSVSSKEEHPDDLKILQQNCNGLRGKIDEILHYMNEKNVSIAALQETKLPKNSKLSTPGWACVRTDRPKGKGGGIALLVKKNVNFTVVTLPTAPNDDTIEQQAIAVKLGNKDLTIVNCYIPPQSSCTTRYKASLQHLTILQSTLLLGDINAHNELWDTRGTTDTRGDEIAEEIIDSDWVILNEDFPTRSPANGPETSPDISLTTSDIATIAEWDVTTELTSDHLPICISLPLDDHKTVDNPRRCFTNFKKADWENFTKECEEEFAKLQPPRDAISARRNSGTS